MTHFVLWELLYHCLFHAVLVILFLEHPGGDNGTEPRNWVTLVQEGILLLLLDQTANPVEGQEFGA